MLSASYGLWFVPVGLTACGMLLRLLPMVKRTTMIGEVLPLFSLYARPHTNRLLRVSSVSAGWCPAGIRGIGFVG